MAITDIVKKSLTPLLYINFVAMVFGGLSLLWVGGFNWAWPGILLLFMSPVVFPFLILPAAITSGLLRLFIKSKAPPALEKLATFLSVVYLVSVLSGWTVMCFYFLVGAPTVAAIFYATSSSVLPWLIFAAKDRENAFFTGLVIEMQFSALVLLTLNVWLKLTDFVEKFWIIWGVMMICVGIEAVFEHFTIDKKKDEPVNPAS